ncbi:MAG: winged helix-turn-helix transcriptional regulator [Ruminiclostridium sp.]|nr:winged helix-turn-helix transcriptional regulator [Ruminiclostridium sp.]
MKISETFKILSDDQRRDIIAMLRDGRKNAGEIAENLGITPAALSYHLKLLKKADMVIEYKEKNFIYYELNTSVFDEILVWLGQFGVSSDKVKAGELNEE